MKKNIFLIVLIILVLSFSVMAQEIKSEEPTVQLKQSTVDACAKAFDEVLALRNLTNALKDELVTNKDLRVKEEVYNAELLKAVGLLVSSEKRNKGFFTKVIEQLGKVLRAATKPEHLTTIVTLIVLLKKM